MGQNTSACLKQAKKRVLASFFGRMEPSIQANGQKIRYRALEYTSGLMAGPIKASF